MRIGFLPRRKQWNDIVEKLSLFGGNPADARQIAEATLKAIQNNYLKLSTDESVIKAVNFLATLAHSANQDDQTTFLNGKGYSVDDNMSLYSILSSAQEYINTEYGSLEANKMTRDAAMKAIMTYYDVHKSEQMTLFGENTENVWSSAGTGAAFCEMARTFFAELTDRQLRYCIEREAARTINDFAQLKSFNDTLTNQTASISAHALDTSKLIQSLAAGWFNKRIILSLPTDEQLRQFTDYSFRKMREEFRREGDKQ